MSEMFDLSADPSAAGWRALPGAALPSGIGVPWARRQDGLWRYGLLTVLGHGLSMLAWEAASRLPCATIQLNGHFLDAVRPGEFVELHGEITRRTRALVFVRGLLRVAGREVVAADGIWRVLKPA
jgi:hypothetical protein